MQQSYDMLNLQGVHIENFRAIRKAYVPLDPRLTVFIGDNATGKTAILEGIAIALSTLTRHFSSPSRREPNLTIYDFRADADDLLGEPFRAQSLSIELDTSFSNVAVEYHLDDKYADHPRVRSIRNPKSAARLNHLLDSDEIAPILAFYKDDRAQSPRSERPAYRRRPDSDRRTAYLSAFGGRVIFEDAVDWFEEAESAELRDQRESGGRYRDQRLDAVRRAVEKLVPEVSNLRMLGRPPQLSLTLKNEGQEPVLLSASQLSSGFRAMVALAMDLARRMADLNPMMQDPLESPGVVLIDEIDLHLHPRWQQLVIKGLLDAFPNIQFILTTHSPQVLSTLRENNVIKLHWLDGELQLSPVPSTEGAESGRLLSAAMDVSERPPAEVSEFVSHLEKYLEWLRLGQSDHVDARRILNRMQHLSPDDPILVTLDLEKRRLAARK